MAAPPSELDWDACREFFRIRLTRHLGGPDRGPLDDLVQEACIRLLRAVRTQPPDNLEGLMAVIAGRTWKDHLRRNSTQKKYFSSLDDDTSRDVASFAAEDPALGELRDRLELVVQEIFESHGRPECRELALRYFDEHDWKVIGEDLGLGYAAVRKRWSRCLTLVRESFASDPRFVDLAVME